MPRSQTFISHLAKSTASRLHGGEQSLPISLSSCQLRRVDATYSLSKPFCQADHWSWCHGSMKGRSILILEDVCHCREVKKDLHNQLQWGLTKTWMWLFSPTVTKNYMHTFTWIGMLQSCHLLNNIQWTQRKYWSFTVLWQQFLSISSWYATVFHEYITYLHGSAFVLIILILCLHATKAMKTIVFITSLMCSIPSPLLILLPGPYPIVTSHIQFVILFLACFNLLTSSLTTQVSPPYIIVFLTHETYLSCAGKALALLKEPILLTSSTPNSCNDLASPPSLAPVISSS